MARPGPHHRSGAQLLHLGNAGDACPAGSEGDVNERMSSTWGGEERLGGITNEAVEWGGQDKPLIPGGGSGIREDSRAHPAL